VLEWLERDAAAREGRQLRGLAELGEMSLAMARTVSKQVEAKVAAVAGDDPGAEVDVAIGRLSMAFTHLGRSVRQSYSLEGRIAEVRRRRMAGVEIVRAEAAARIAERKAHEDCGRMINAAFAHDILDEMIEAEHEDEATIVRLHDEAYALLVEAKDEEDFNERATGELVATIAQAIGLNPDWTQWEDEEWAEEDREERAWGSPYGRGFKAWGKTETEPLPPCGERVGDGGIGSGEGDLAQDNLDRRCLTPTPGPFPQGGGESTGPP